MQDYRKLTVWKKSRLLAVAIYKVTAGFPKSEMYGFTSQIRRACTSIPKNTAEKCEKSGGAELSHFLQYAQGSASELEYQLLLARELNFTNILNFNELSSQLNEDRRMLTALLQKIKTNN